jgi:putative membrane protein
MGVGYASHVGLVGSVGRRDDGDDAGVLGVVIVGIVLAIRWMVRQGRPSRSTDAALDILRQRYARGDITKEEFEAKKRDLS